VTVIVAVPHNGRVYMGADSRATQGWSIIELAEPKLWKQGGLLLGFTGAIREQQILQFCTAIPARSDDVDVLHWLCSDFVGAVRAARQSAGYDVKCPSPACDAGPSLAIGVEGRLFEVFADYSIAERLAATAIGSGGVEAKASLHTTAGMRMAVRKRIDLALATACALDAGCSPPFTYGHE